MEIGTIGEHDQLLLEAAPKTKKRKKTKFSSRAIHIVCISYQVLVRAQLRGNNSNVSKCISSVAQTKYSQKSLPGRKGMQSK